MIQLIPVVIGQLLHHRLTVTEQTSLQQVFGSLWPLISDEAKRRSDKIRYKTGDRTEPANAVNPVLRAILRAQRSFFADATTTNDIYHNTVGQLLRTDRDAIARKLAAHWRRQRNGAAAAADNEMLEPSQRILKIAAILIHEQMMQKEQRKRPKMEIVKKDQAAAAAAMLHLELEAAAATNEVKDSSMQRRRRRGKRDVLDVLGELSASELSALNALIGDEDIYDDDMDEADAADNNNGRANDNDMFGMSADSFNKRNTADYQDYAFDVTAADDGDDLLRRMYGTVDDDYDGSVSELFQLATTHNLRRQRDNDYLKDDGDYFKDFLKDSILTSDAGDDDEDDY